MAWILKTYTVISSTPVVVEDDVFASTTVYQPGATFEARENNPSIVRLLEDGAIIDVDGADPTEGFLIVEGDTGPAGPTGPGALNDLAITLGIGNVTGLNDILITGGQKIMGGRACFGSSTSAVADGDISAGDGTREFSWIAVTGVLTASNATQTLSYDPGLARTRTIGPGTVVLEVISDTAGVAGRGLISAWADNAFCTNIQAFSSLYNQVGTIDIPLAGAITTDSGATAGLTVGPLAAAPLRFVTSNIIRWSINAGGGLITAADDTHDIGIAAMNRPRTLFLSRSLDVGTTTGSTVIGDIKAGDGVNELFWDASDGLLTVPNLHVSGTTTIVDTEIQTADNYILINSDYTGDSPQTAGLVFNVDPSATSFSISAIATNVITVVAGDPSAVLSAADFVLIQDPASLENSGVYEVLSTTATTITIDTTPAEPFAGTGLTDDATVQGIVVGIAVTLFETTIAGLLQSGFGSTSPLARVSLGTHDLLNVGASTTSAVADGDLAAGDGTREMFFDASAGALALTGPTATTITRGTLTSDITTTGFTIEAQSPASSSTANRAGGELILASRQGLKFFQVVDYAAAVTNTIELFVDGVWTVLTNGTEFTAVTSDEVTAGLIAGAINTAAVGVSGTAVGDIVEVRPTGGTSWYGIDESGSGTPWTVNWDFDAPVTIPTFLNVGLPTVNPAPSDWDPVARSVGDLHAGDGAASLDWNASQREFSVGREGSTNLFYDGGSWFSDPTENGKLYIRNALNENTIKASGNGYLRIGRDFAGGTTVGASSSGDFSCGETGQGQIDFDSSVNEFHLLGIAAKIDSDNTLTVGGAIATALTLGRAALGVSVPGWVNVGSATTAVALGDIAGGDGTNFFAYVNSTGVIALDRTQAIASTKTSSLVVNTRLAAGSGALDGFGSQIVWQATTSAPGFQTQASMEVAWKTAASAISEIVFRCADGSGVNEKMTIDGAEIRAHNELYVGTVTAGAGDPFTLSAGTNADRVRFVPASVGGPIWQIIRTATTNTQVEMLLLQSSKTVGGPGLGSRIQFAAGNSAGGDNNQGSISCVWAPVGGATAGNIHSNITLRPRWAGTVVEALLVGNSVSSASEFGIEFRNPSNANRVVFNTEAGHASFGDVSSSAAAGLGDLWSGDGTNEFLFDASVGAISVTPKTYAGAAPVFSGELALLTAVGMSAYFTKGGANTYLAFRHSIGAGDATDFHMVMLS